MTAKISIRIHGSPRNSKQVLTGLNRSPLLIRGNRRIWRSKYLESNSSVSGNSASLTIHTSTLPHSLYTLQLCLTHHMHLLCLTLCLTHHTRFLLCLTHHTHFLLNIFKTHVNETETSSIHAFHIHTFHSRYTHPTHTHTPVSLNTHPSHSTHTPPLTQHTCMRRRGRLIHKCLCLIHVCL